MIGDGTILVEEQRKFDSGAVRDSVVGKGRFDLLPPHALLRLARRYEYGSARYSDRNWEKGIPLSCFVDSGLRHLVCFMAGDRSEDHLAAVLWNIAGYMQTERWVIEGKIPEQEVIKGERPDPFSEEE